MDVIKVRGKRHQRKENSIPGRRRGRPMKPYRELAKAKKHGKGAFSLTESQQDRSSLSELERLPIELVEQIFFYAEEPSLPQASLGLGKMLSSERIYRDIVIRAFGGTADRRYPLDEQTRLQCAILGTKWCTVTRIKSVLPLMARSAQQQAWMHCCQINPSVAEDGIEGHFELDSHEYPTRLKCSCNVGLYLAQQ